MSDEVAKKPWFSGWRAVWVTLAISVVAVVAVTALVIATTRTDNPVGGELTYLDEPTDSVCGLGRVAADRSSVAGDPEVEWREINRMYVPVSPEYGPGELTADHPPRCFENSPRGALFATSSFALMISNPKYVDLEQLTELFPEETDEQLLESQLEHIQVAREERFEGADSALGGFRLMRFEDGHTAIEIAVSTFDGTETTRTGLLFDVVWVDGDWRINPEEGAVQFQQLRDFVGFQNWRA